jgi:hypothetical protein
MVRILSTSPNQTALRAAASMIPNATPEVGLTDRDRLAAHVDLAVGHQPGQ